MSATHQYHDGSDWVGITDRVTTEDWAYTEAEEEGTSNRSTIAVPDQSLDFEPVGHRPFRVFDVTSEADDDVLFGGFTWNNDSGRKQGEEVELLARAITIQIDDANAVWQRPVMVGSDCNRGDETDIERMTWLLGTNELAIIDDTTTYFHGGDHAYDMDANDYRGQHADQIARDCAEQSGKNWWVKLIGGGDGRLLRSWYGRDSNDTYDSELFLTNDPAEWDDAELLDGTSLVWPGQDWKVERDYSRIYCSIYAQWDGGASFVHSSAIHTAYFNDVGPDSHRTMTVPMPNVHTVTRAKARAARMLADIEDPDIHVTATIRLPAAKATMLRSGMRVPIMLTHEPEFSDAYKWCRIVNAEVTAVAAGQKYDIAIEATPTGPPDSSGPALPEGATDGAVLWEPGSTFEASPDTQGDITWHGSGDNPGTGYPGPGGGGPIDSAAFAYLGAYPNHSGFTVLAATGTLDIYLQLDLADAVVGPTRTYTLRLLLNGTPVATQALPGGPGGVYLFFAITVSDLAVVAGDELTVDMTTSDLSGHSIPAGTGATSNRFQILNTSTVS
jgi:hypothetical protein